MFTSFLLSRSVKYIENGGTKHTRDLIERHRDADKGAVNYD